MSKRRVPAQKSRVRRKKSSMSSYLPIFGGLLALAVLGAFMFTRPPPVDPSTFCTKDTSSIGMTALLIDVSDELSSAQGARLQKEIEAISSTSEERQSAFLKKGDKLVVYFVEAQGQVPSMVFSMCHPGDVENRSLSDSLSEGAIIANKKWQKFKSDTLVTIEQKIDSSSNLDTSPLIEAIQYIRSKDFPPPAVIDRANDYQFVIWSDMIQNSDQSNHFAELGSYKTVLKNNPIDLKGIGLSVFQLRSKRYSKFQTNEHVAWWRKFIAYANGELNGWDPI
jgi:hypothetical protein